MLCKHWQLDWSEAHKNNPLLYWQNRTCEICFRIPYFTQSKKEQSHWVRFWGIFVPRQKTYLIKAGENQVNKGHDITSKYIFELLCRQSKILIPAADLKKFCKWKFKKCRILFCAVFVFYLYVNYSAELDVYHNVEQPYIAARPIIRSSQLCFICRFSTLSTKWR